MTNDSDRDVAALQRVTRDLLGVAMTTVGASTEVSMPQMRLMFAVHDARTASCGSLATDLGIAASSVTRLADRLEASGHLTRTHSTDNRSVVLLSLTDAGREVIDTVLARRATIFRKALSAMDSDARAALIVGLGELHVALRDVVDEGR